MQTIGGERKLGERSQTRQANSSPSSHFEAAGGGGVKEEGGWEEEAYRRRSHSDTPPRLFDSYSFGRHGDQ